MIPISSTLNGKQLYYNQMNEGSGQLGFVLSGNWDYHAGFFDKALDDENKVWVRVPFKVETGTVVSEASTSDAYIQLGEPFVLHHIYQEGNDPRATSGVVMASFNQFQAPVDEDASVSKEWIEKGKSEVAQLEQALARYFQSESL